MITTWLEFFNAVEQMRECQKEHSRTNSLGAGYAAKKCEKAVDDGINYIRAKMAREKQPELTGVKQ